MISKFKQGDKVLYREGYEGVIVTASFDEEENGFFYLVAFDKCSFDGWDSYCLKGHELNDATAIGIEPTDYKYWYVCEWHNVLEPLDEIELLNKRISEAKSKGKLSDGYHTFDELYYHRMVLFALFVNFWNGNSWKSWKHHDGTMYEDYFIVGITTPEGDYSYHYHKEHWDMFKVNVVEKAPEWDGHKPDDIERLFSVINKK